MFRIVDADDRQFLWCETASLLLASIIADALAKHQNTISGIRQGIVVLHSNGEVAYSTAERMNFRDAAKAVMKQYQQ